MPCKPLLYASEFSSILDTIDCWTSVSSVEKIKNRWFRSSISCF